MNTGNFPLAWMQSEYEWYCCKLWVLFNFPECARFIPTQTQGFAFLLAEFRGISACTVLKFLKVHLGWNSSFQHVSHSHKSTLSWKSAEETLPLFRVLMMKFSSVLQIPVSIHELLHSSPVEAGATTVPSSLHLPSF